MIEFFGKLFKSDFMPHGHCYFWKPELVWLHVTSDAIIALSYYFIPLALLYFVRKRRDLPFHWMFIMFGIFILGCGTTHVMEIWTLWHGTYRLAGVFKAVTAMASVATAIALVPLIPRAIALPSPAQLQAANDELEQKTQLIQALSADHVTRLEEERRNVSREIHDEAGQALIGIKLGLQVLARQMPAEHPELREQLDRLREQVNESTSQLKDMARRLRPVTLDELGLEDALRQLATDLEERTGLRVRMDLDARLTDLPQSAEIAVYRIAQEALANAAVHAAARDISMQLRSGEAGLELVVRDDGCGFDPKAAPKGMGLLGMKERVDMLRGQIRIVSGRGQGTIITVVLPSKKSPAVGVVS
ncbi:MAG: sensor histidine kinase [Bryobacteraceae bacterium]